jgi:hypothetical protein
MIEVFHLENKNNWSAMLELIAYRERDITYSPDYYSIFETSLHGIAECFACKVGNKVALYPYLKNSINDLGYKLDAKYYDIQGAYGYNGIISNTSDASFSAVFEASFTQHCVDNNIVAEFTRFNPVLENHSNSFHLKPEYNQENIVLNLRTLDIQNTEYEYATRKNIRKAKRNNLACMIIPGDEMGPNYLEAFMKIYLHTMERNSAEAYYHFSIGFIQNIANALGGRCRFYFTLQDNEIISAELVIIGGSIAYSFLGGTVEEYFQFRPNDFLKDAIIHNLKENGMDYFCLGGGSAGVIRYKKSFAKTGTRKFYVGKKIHNSPVYNELIAQWETQNPEPSVQSNKLLKYRELIR